MMEHYFFISDKTTVLIFVKNLKRQSVNYSAKKFYKFVNRWIPERLFCCENFWSWFVNERHYDNTYNDFI